MTEREDRIAARIYRCSTTTWPGVTSLYVAKNHTDAKRQAWGTLSELGHNPEWVTMRARLAKEYAGMTLRDAYAIEDRARQEGREG